MEQTLEYTKEITQKDNKITIHEIIIRLKKIVEETKKENPNLCYFAILYLYVTIRVSQKIKEKCIFEDNNRMEDLDVIFALRYIDAYENWKKGKPITNSWKIAFDFGKEEGSMIMQHLLLGMNAHINLDLGIATVEATNTSSDDCYNYKNFNSIIKDFTTINDVLNDLTTTVEDCLAKSSFFFGLIRKYGKNKEAILADFSVNYARTGAWYFASFYRKNMTIDVINKRDNDIHKLAFGMTQPKSKFIKTALYLGSLSEKLSSKNFIPSMIKELDKKIGVEYDAIQ